MIRVAAAYCANSLKLPGPDDIYVVQRCAKAVELIWETFSGLISAKLARREQRQSSFADSV